MSDKDDVVLGQVALVVDRASADETKQWYQDAFGLVSAGGSDDAGGVHANDLQQLDEPDPALGVRWLLDRSDLFQFEIFTYQRPVTRPRRDDWTPRDIGYSMVSLCVSDFDESIVRVTATGATVGAVSGPAGARRAMTSDPNGTLVELIEGDIAVPGDRPPARPGIGAVVRSVRLSVPDLDRSAVIFRECFGLADADPRAVHGPEHEDLWGLSGERPRVRTFAAGNAYLEVVEYDPAGRARAADYRLSDAGIMNIALVTRSRQSYQTLTARAREWGFEIHELLPGDHSACAYIWDDQGFCTEVLFVAPTEFADRALGFRPENDQ